VDEVKEKEVCTGDVGKKERKRLRKEDSTEGEKGRTACQSQV